MAGRLSSLQRLFVSPFEGHFEQNEFEEDKIACLAPQTDADGCSPDVFSDSGSVVALSPSTAPLHFFSLSWFNRHFPARRSDLWTLPLSASPHPPLPHRLPACCRPDNLSNCCSSRFQRLPGLIVFRQEISALAPGTFHPVIHLLKTLECGLIRHALESDSQRELRDVKSSYRGF